MANSAITFNGLSSGLDTKAIIDKLVAAKTKQLVDPIKQQISDIKTRDTALDSLAELFRRFKDAAKTLKDPSNEIYSSKTGVSSDTSKVLVTSVNSLQAINGTYNISSVSQLARADRVIFSGVADRTTTTFGTGTFGITYKGTTTSVTITSSNNTLDGIVGAINSANAGVTASIISDGNSSIPYRLVLTANTTGSDTRITHTINTTLTGLSVDTDASGAAANEPQSAVFNVNNVSTSSTTNEVSTAIPGVTFSLLNTDTTNTNTITVKQNTASTVSAISAFVNAYKNLREGLKNAISPDKTTGEFGPLGHDIALTSANVNIHNIFSRSFIGLSGYSYQSLSQVGITSDAAGNIQIDTARLTAALESHPTDVRLLFQGSTSEDGIAEDLYDYLDLFTKPTGLFASRSENDLTQLQSLASRLEEQQKRVDDFELQLSRKFTAMEKAISLLNTKQSAIDAYTSTYNNSSNKLL